MRRELAQEAPPAPDGRDRDRDRSAAYEVDHAVRRRAARDRAKIGAGRLNLQARHLTTDGLEVALQGHLDRRCDGVVRGEREHAALDRLVVGHELDGQLELLVGHEPNRERRRVRRERELG